MANYNFYHNSLKLLRQSGIHYLIGGAHALQFYSGIKRDTKDLDIFCYESDYHQISTLFKANGYDVQLTDERWIGKVFFEDHFIDLIFSSINSLCPVDSSWFDDARTEKLFDIEVKIPSAEIIFWTKLYIKHRDRYDGADLNHLILKQGHKMNWSSIIKRSAGHHQLLLAQILEFLYVYPGYQKQIPDWVFNELIEEARQIRHDINDGLKNICRGPLIDRKSYDVDVLQWSFETYYD